MGGAVGRARASKPYCSISMDCFTSGLNTVCKIILCDCSTCLWQQTERFPLTLGVNANFQLEWAEFETMLWQHPASSKALNTSPVSMLLLCLKCSYYIILQYTVNIQGQYSALVPEVIFPLWMDGLWKIDTLFQDGAHSIQWMTLSQLTLQRSCPTSLLRGPLHMCINVSSPNAHSRLIDFSWRCQAHKNGFARVLKKGMKSSWFKNV